MSLLYYCGMPRVLMHYIAKCVVANMCRYARFRDHICMHFIRSDRIVYYCTQPENGPHQYYTTGVRNDTSPNYACFCYSIRNETANEIHTFIFSTI